MDTHYADVAVIGAGIVGLAHAYAAAKRGHKVVLFERTEPAVGASIRNFGLVWPIGQPSGHLYERALRSRAIWLEVSAQVGFWCAQTGSLHLAYQADERDVLVEYLDTTPSVRDTTLLLAPAEVATHSATANQHGLLCGMWSSTELNVDPRQAIRVIPGWLERAYGVTLRFGTPINGIATPQVETATERWHVDHTFVCSGPDFETLYPQVFAQSGITKCKLQMLRTGPQPQDWQLGPSLCAGLTLLHYGSFAHCATLGPLRERVRHEMPFYLDNGIHVLLSQTALGELTIGDSHAYGLTHDPFEYQAIDEAILRYLWTFAQPPERMIAERWHGIYPTLRDKGTELIVTPEPDVTIVNGLGGAGMTLSFGLAEEVVPRVLGKASSI